MIEKSNKSNKIVPAILVILLVVSIGFNIYLFEDNKKNDLDFFNDYVVAVNDYHTADSFSELGRGNLDTAIWSAESEEYYYDQTTPFFDLAKEQFTDARELLIHSEAKLRNIEDKVPNQFYEKEVQNRKEQINIMISLVKQYYNLADYKAQEFYEVNYGSETEATRYFNLYNDLVSEVNENMKKLSDISQEIDLAWDQDWYPLFEGS